MTSRTWTVEEIRALGVRCDLETAAAVWGIGRTKAFELARAGEFPSPVLRVGIKYVALVTPMLRALGVDDEPDSTNDDPSTEEPPSASIHALAKQEISSDDDTPRHTPPAA